MPREEEELVAQWLAYWESRSNKIKTFECTFHRWDYDPAFGPKNKAKTIATGTIKYAQPDKGLYRVEKLLGYVAPTKPGDQEYFEQDAIFGEHWVCDGKVIYSFEATKKQLTVTPLPLEMQGQAIADGPLPFMFGAKAETIKARYYLRRWPEGDASKYWLEAVPKSRQDSQNFSRVIIGLSEKEFLPEILQVFAPNFDPVKNPAKQTYQFPVENRKTTDAATIQDAIRNGLDPLNLFHREFYEPKTPAGWRKVVQNDLVPALGAPQQTAQPPSGPRQLSPLPR